MSRERNTLQTSGYIREIAAGYADQEHTGLVGSAMANVGATVRVLGGVLNSVRAYEKKSAVYAQGNPRDVEAGVWGTVALLGNVERAIAYGSGRAIIFGSAERVFAYSRGHITLVSPVPEYMPEDIVLENHSTLTVISPGTDTAPQDVAKLADFLPLVMPCEKTNRLYHQYATLLMTNTVTRFAADKSQNFSIVV